jgi:predicted tellurium resistance membrane protein TerC
MGFLDWIGEPKAWISLATLTLLEIVLGIDNIIFISILAAKLPSGKQARARKTGIALALITRILLLLSITWVMGLVRPLFAIFGHEFTGRDLILLSGGLFLIAKGTQEIHDKLEAAGERRSIRPSSRFARVVILIMLFDVVFSLDSVITAVGLAQYLPIMILAVTLAMFVMLAASGTISDFVNRHPTIKMLALSFLILIGVVLFADGLGQHIDRGYIYFAMAFSAGVEMLNLRIRAKQIAQGPPRRNG